MAIALHLHKDAYAFMRTQLDKKIPLPKYGFNMFKAKKYSAISEGRIEEEDD